MVSPVQPWSGGGGGGVVVNGQGLFFIQHAMSRPQSLMQRVLVYFLILILCLDAVLLLAKRSVEDESVDQQEQKRII